MSEQDEDGPFLGLFPGGSYPSQLRAGPQAGYHGEYRGFYPEGNTGGGKWRPKWSQDKPTSSQDEQRPGGHRGVDIYAPYAPHPLETPVLAVVGGRLTCRPGRFDPNAIGNRAEIHFGTENKKFSYGHLSRFAGRDRKVERGQLIGYAGCTGNADTKGECRSCGDCNVNSGHVHLQVMRNEGEYFDPLEYCDLKLHTAFAEEFQGKDCSVWVHVATGKGLAQKWTPQPPRAEKTRLECQTKPDWRRVGGKRRPLDEPFEHLEFDSTSLLQASQLYYDVCRRRFAEAAVVELASAGAAKQLKDLLELNLAAASNALRGQASASLTMMREQIFAGEAVIGLGATDEAARAPGWLLRHLSVLCKMWWVAAGGPALDLFADNAANGSYSLHTLLKPKGAYRRLHTPSPLECGASLGGYAWLSAADSGQQALHLTQIATPATAEDGENHWIASVTFGAGSLMHATISERMKHPPQGRAPESAEDEQAIAAYVDALYVAAVRITDVYELAALHPVLLSNEGGATVQAGRAETLRQLREAIDKGADAIEACARKVTGDPLARKILKRMAESHAELFGDLVRESKKPEEKPEEIVMCPSLSMFQVREPKRG